MRDSILRNALLLGMGALPLACGSAADTGEAEPIAQSEEAVISFTSPYVGPVATGDIPALTLATGTLPDALVDSTDVQAVHGGRYSNAYNLWVGAGHDQSAWITQATGGTNASYECAPTFKDALSNAVTAATKLKSVIGQTASGSAFEAFGGAPTLKSIDERFTSFPTERARWQKFQRTSPLSFYRYSDPWLFSELRQRGARKYCSARAAEVKQAGQPGSMGEVPGFTMKLLGHPIDFLVVEPMVGLAGASKQTNNGANDGVEAFTIPMQLGNRVTPIRGLPGIDGVGEVRYPVALISGESEVYSASNKYASLTLYNKAWQTITHADAMYSVSSPYTSVGRTVPLFSVGPAVFNLKVSYGFSTGIPDWATTNSSSGLTVSPNVWPPPGGNDNTRLLDTMYYNSDAPGPMRLGWEADDYSWNGVAWRRASNGVNWDAGSAGTISGGYPLGAIRALQNDDQHVEFGSGFVLSGTIEGSIPVNFGVFDISLSAGGTINGRVQQRHVVRDAVEVGGGTFPGYPFKRSPAADISVKPRTISSSDAQLYVHFYMGIDLGWPIGSVDIFDDDLLSTTLPVSSWDSDSTPNQTWKETSNLRLGYSSETQPSSQMSQPSVRSHLPLGSGYTTFDQSVDACIADTSTTPALGDPCKPVESTVTTQPQAYVCAWESLRGCQNIGYIASFMQEGPQKDCFVTYMTYLCSQTSKDQSYKVAHRFPLEGEPNAAADAAAFRHAFDVCRDAYLPGVTDGAAISAWADSFFKSALCDAEANLIAPSDAVSFDNTSTAPAANTSTPACY